MKLKELYNTLKQSTIKNSPTILVGLGIASMIGGTILAVKATPKALDLLADVKSEEKTKKEQAKDIVLKVAPVYIPAVIAEGVGVACIVGASKVNHRRNAALSAAYALSEKTLTSYQNKLIEVVGKNKTEALKDAVAKDEITKNPVSSREVIITSKGDTLFYDSVSGRYFESDMETLRKIQNDLNQRLMNEMYIGLNELNYEIGLACTEQGNVLGFNIDDGLIQFEFSAQITEDGRPCIVLGYRVGPRYGYGDLKY